MKKLGLLLETQKKLFMKMLTLLKTHEKAIVLMGHNEVPLNNVTTVLLIFSFWCWQGHGDLGSSAEYTSVMHVQARCLQAVLNNSGFPIIPPPLPSALPFSFHWASQAQAISWVTIDNLHQGFPEIRKLLLDSPGQILLPEMYKPPMIVALPDARDKYGRRNYVGANPVSCCGSCLQNSHHSYILSNVLFKRFFSS